MKFQAALLVVKNMERSVKFYKEVLGLRVTMDLGANVTLQFRPDDAYDEMFASWIYGKTEK